MGCNLLALQEKSAPKNQPGPQVDSIIPDAPMGLCTPTHCQAAQSDSPHGNAKRRKDALIPGKAQPSPRLQPNCPGALASRPKPGYPLAEPHAWEDDACANVRDRAAFVYRLLAMALHTPHPPPARSELQERKLHKPEGLME